MITLYIFILLWFAFQIELAIWEFRSPSVSSELVRLSFAWKPVMEWKKDNTSPFCWTLLVLFALGPLAWKLVDKAINKCKSPAEQMTRFAQRTEEPFSNWVSKNDSTLFMTLKFSKVLGIKSFHHLGSSLLLCTKGKHTCCAFGALACYPEEDWFLFVPRSFWG